MRWRIRPGVLLALRHVVGAVGAHVSASRLGGGVDHGCPEDYECCARRGVLEDTPIVLACALKDRPWCGFGTSCFLGTCSAFAPDADTAGEWKRVDSFDERHGRCGAQTPLYEQDGEDWVQRQLGWEPPPRGTAALRAKPVGYDDRLFEVQWHEVYCPEPSDDWPYGSHSVLVLVAEGGAKCALERDILGAAIKPLAEVQQTLWDNNCETKELRKAPVRPHTTIRTAASELRWCREPYDHRTNNCHTAVAKVSSALSEAQWKGDLESLSSKDCAFCFGTYTFPDFPFKPNAKVEPRARFAAWLSDWVYDHGDLHDDESPVKFIRRHFVHSKSGAHPVQWAQVWAPADDTTYIVFRGTDNVVDALIDVEIEPHELPDKTRVHGGFWDALLKRGTFEDVAQRLQVAGGKVILSGHSMGAAYAVLMALYLLHRGQQVDAVITFGTPQVVIPPEGGSKLLEHLNKIATLYVHAWDCVARLPSNFRDEVWAVGADAFQHDLLDVVTTDVQAVDTGVWHDIMLKYDNVGTLMIITAGRRGALAVPYSANGDHRRVLDDNRGLLEYDKVSRTMAVIRCHYIKNYLHVLNGIVGPPEFASRHTAIPDTARYRGPAILTGLKRQPQTSNADTTRTEVWPREQQTPVHTTVLRKQLARQTPNPLLRQQEPPQNGQPISTVYYRKSVADSQKLLAEIGKSPAYQHIFEPKSTVATDPRQKAKDNPLMAGIPHRP